ncbi:translation elongation factor Ts [Candidatus Comchoanobacter bicostacola]|uniref:Elongation factor Ts n=1 Tax=Candidatus Comchoanobacter bicostacola TaxID=2919598 RepID=A0ABY5DJD9_9GAMM|nr:translation elongation factor Ts [Candidatus Comchoanobacter bicostacola]UTC24658.1 translation elongation factor Ts [Candidatus Comchoanobacter bicostacola]
MSAKVDVKLVKALRDATGVGISDCKNALVESQGDLDKAKDILRAKGMKTASSKSARQASEGEVAVALAKDSVVFVQVNCETDFVARESGFKTFAQAVADIALATQSASLDDLLKQEMGSGTVEDERVALVSRVGENVQISGVTYKQVDNAHASVYQHGGKVACAVFLEQDQLGVGKEVAMHVVAMQPIAVDSSGVSLEVIERERAVFTAQTEKMGKNPQMTEKIVEGKLGKFFKEVCLLDQAFVKDSNITVSAYLAQTKTRVLDFIRVELGE